MPVFLRKWLRNGICRETWFAFRWGSEDETDLIEDLDQALCRASSTFAFTEQSVGVRV